MVPLFALMLESAIVAPELIDCPRGPFMAIWINPSSRAAAPTFKVPWLTWVMPWL